MKDSIGGNRMRKTININANWEFSKDNTIFEAINLPHTWNNLDGQDGLVR